MSRCVAVTGCCGFIGRYVTQKLLARGDWVYGVDALTYAADPTLLWNHAPGQMQFVVKDINDLGFWPDVDAVLNLAAETHVCNSLEDSSRFIRTNVGGVHHLLEMGRAKSHNGMPLFLHISTDEVYGEVLSGATDESAPLSPSSPYAASKAAADCLVQAWGHTFGLPYRIVRPSNCYGLGQYPEKLIPKAVRRLTLGQPIPIHGDGTAIRSWLWVEDCADAILAVLDRGTDGEIYNIPGASSLTVREVALGIVTAFGKGMDNDTVEMGFERPGLDRRYQVSGEKLKALGWTAKGELRRDLPALVAAERESVRW